MPLPNRKEPIQEASLKDDLIRFTKLAPQIHPNNKRVEYLLAQIERLEMPSLEKSTYWDTIENPEEYLELISDLSILLMEEIPKGYNPLHFRYGREVISSYKLLAIMDLLAKRSQNAQLDGFRVYAYPLLQWYSKNESMLDDPLAMNQFRQVAAYLLPDIDLENIPNEAEIQKKANQTLFHYNSRENKILGDLEHRLSKTISKAELQYYDELIKDPEFRNRLKEIGLPEGLNTDEIRLILFQEAFIFTREKPLVPKAFCLLACKTCFVPNCFLMVIIQMFITQP